jgi:gliding motility-associated-like protein
MKKTIWIIWLFVASAYAIGSVYVNILDKDQSPTRLSKLTLSSEKFNDTQKEKDLPKDNNTHISKWSADLKSQKVIIQNKGQFKADPSLGLDEQIQFAFDGSSEDVFFTPTKVILELVKKSLPEQTEQEIARKKERKAKGFASREEVLEYRSHNRRITFDKEILVSEWLGANSNAILIPENENSFKHTYMYKDQNNGVGVATLVSSYNRLVYKNLYDNIDVIYEIHPETGYKYSVIVHPGGDLNEVKLNYSKSPIVADDGTLRIPTKFGEIIDHAPVTFYAGNSGEIIESEYVVNGNVISFKVGDYDQSKTLIVDPWTQSPSFPTNWDCIWEVETDASGNSYLIGGVMPLTLQKYNSAGALQWTFNTPYDSTSWLGTFATDDLGNSFVTNGSAAAIIKVNNAGVLQWNNPNPGGIFTLTEFWNIAFNCDQTKLIIGGTSGVLNPVPAVYNINVTNGNVIQSQDVTGAGTLFGFPPNTNEVRAVTATSNNKYYFLTHDSIGYVSDNLALCPGQTGPFHVENGGYNLSYKNENWRYDNTGVEALAYYNGFVFVNRGNRLDKRDFNTAAILQSVTIPGGGWTASLGQNQMQNSGIAIDQCGNIFVGSKTGVYKFDQSLTETGFYATTFNVYDVAIVSNGEIVAGGSTGNSSNSSRTGTIQSFAASACSQPVTVCCNPSICPQPPLCTADAAVTLTAQTAGGTWSISPATAGFNTSTGTFNPSVAGAGTFTVTYTLVCGSESTTITVSPCAAIEVCEETNGDLTVTGGTGPYTWQNWQPASSTPITNQTQCEACGYTWFAGIPFVLPAQCQNAMLQQVTACNTPAGWVTVGTGTTITPPVGSTQMQVLDNVGGSLQFNPTTVLPCVTNPCPTITVTMSNVNNVTCFGLTNGSATATATGGAGPYTYTWTPGNLNVATQTTLGAGNYTINVLDNNSCPGTGSVTITQPSTALTATASSTPTGCGASTGTATASPTGGAPGYTYSWSPSGGTGVTASNLAAGAYTVTVTDLNGCITTANTTVATTNGPTISVATSNDVSCFGDTDGSATVAGSGGTGTLTYNWMPGNLSGTTQSALDAGSYTVTVTDGSGCTNSTTVTINEPLAINITPGTIIPADCGESNGSASVTVTGGAGGFTYSWLPNGGNSTIANNIPSGTYTFEAEDQNGCVATLNVVLTNIGGPTVTVQSSNDVSCFGLSDGSAAVTVSGGTSPYTYNWSPSGGTGATASNLAAGTYTVAVTDNTSCVGSTTVTIGEPNAITVTETITDANCGSSDGSISLVAIGGSSPYTFEWTPNGETTNSINGIAAGPYGVTVTDDNGCSTTESYTVSNIGSIPISVSPVSTTINQGESVQLQATGATTYSWTPTTSLSCNDCPNPVATPNLTTTYTVTGTDAFGCTGSAQVTINVVTLCSDLFVPTVFTPNDQGPAANNILCIHGNCIAELKYSVYNRWGEVVFTTEDPTECWDGTFREKPVQTGVYAYKIYAVLFDGTEINESGNLTILK